MQRAELTLPGVKIEMCADGPSLDFPTGVLAIRLMPTTPHHQTVVRRTLRDGQGVSLAIPGDFAIEAFMPAVAKMCEEIVLSRLIEEPAATAPEVPS